MYSVNAYDMIYLTAIGWQLFSTHVHTNNTGNVTKPTVQKTTQKYTEQHKKYINYIIIKQK